jgi:hypothetical protein
MSRGYGDRILQLLLGGVVIVSLLAGYIYLSASNDIERHDDAYKLGQIDAANGIQNYELQVQPNGESAWVRKETKP